MLSQKWAADSGGRAVNLRVRHEFSLNDYNSFVRIGIGGSHTEHSFVEGADRESAASTRREIRRFERGASLAGV
jgi:hypothetical protein